MTDTHTLNLDEGTLAYELTGPADGPLAVLAHGMGDTRATYRFLVPSLVRAGYRIANLDGRGHGESGRDWPSYGTYQTADDLTALLRELGGGPAVLVGHSYAAGSAALVAGRHPELVDRIILSGPVVRQSRPNPILGALAKLVTHYPALWMMFYKSLYPGAKPADFDAYLADLKTSLKRPGRMGPVRALLDSFPTEAPADLSIVMAPALILMGDKDGDHSDPVGEAHRITDELGGPATAEILPGSGHYPHADAAEATNRAVTAFLKEH